jgi:hypothetical protein
VPRASTPGTATVIVVLSAVISVSSIALPVGPISRSTSGDTGSLNVSFSVAGGCATTARSVGSLRMSEACPCALGD